MEVEEHTTELGFGPVVLRCSRPLPTPTPLYVHTVPTDGEDFASLLTLTGGVAPDLPGFGRTAKGGHLDFSLLGQADFLAALADALGLDQVVLVAHGFGAGGALGFALRQPERVARLALIDPLPLSPEFVPPRVARLWRTRLIGELVMGFTTRGLLRRGLSRGIQRPWSAARHRTLWEEFDQGTQRATLRLVRDADAARRAELADQITRFRAPALVLWGARDPWFGAEHAELYARGLAGAQIEVVEPARHWPWLDDERAREQLSQFVTEGL